MDMSIAQIIIGLIAAVVSAVLIPYIKARTTEQQRVRVSQWVSTAVLAAEQTLNCGKEKKEHVISFLEAQGIQLSADALDAMVEAAVYAMNRDSWTS